MIEYKKNNPSFSDQLWKLFQIQPKNFTFQVTEDCNLKCTYCYQINKSCHAMNFETAKKYCDMILSGTAPYIMEDDGTYPQGAVFEFIGGEPLLQVDLISQICDYLITEMIRLNHPWLLRSRFSISSNGTLYFTPKVQKFIKQFSPWLSFAVSFSGKLTRVPFLLISFWQQPLLLGPLNPEINLFYFELTRNKTIVVVFFPPRLASLDNCYFLRFVHIVASSNSFLFSWSIVL